MASGGVRGDGPAAAAVASGGHEEDAKTTGEGSQSLSAAGSGTPRGGPIFRPGYSASSPSRSGSLAASSSTPSDRTQHSHTPGSANDTTSTTNTPITPTVTKVSAVSSRGPGRDNTTNASSRTGGEELSPSSASSTGQSSSPPPSPSSSSSSPSSSFDFRANSGS